MMLMIVIAVCALFLKVSVEQIMKMSIKQNELTALSALKLISASLENYAQDHQGLFPKDMLSLTKNNPPYLDRDYLADSPIKGYEYACSRLDPFGYSCSAEPVKCGLTGKTDYNITTAGLLISEDCRKDEITK